MEDFHQLDPFKKVAVLRESLSHESVSSKMAKKAAAAREKAVATAEEGVPPANAAEPDRFVVGGMIAFYSAGGTEPVLAEYYASAAPEPEMSKKQKKLSEEKMRTVSVRPM